MKLYQFIDNGVALLFYLRGVRGIIYFYHDKKTDLNIICTSSRSQQTVFWNPTRDKS